MLILKPTIIIIKREYQQILRLPAPIYEIQISHFATLLSPNLRVVKTRTIPADLFHFSSKRLLILKPTIIIIKREYQQILRLPAPISEIQISHFTTLLSPSLRVVKLKPSQRI